LRLATTHRINDAVPLGIKLPPYLDLQYLERIANVIAKYNISFVASSHCIVNAALFVDPELQCNAVPTTDETLGGLCGASLKNIALSNIRRLHRIFKQLKREDISLVGVGGVSSGLDAFEFILCGANAVQVGK
jgi:dihydroorotate dehydrogenase (fumarate)